MNRAWVCQWRRFSFALLLATFTLSLGQPVVYAALEYNEKIPFTDEFDSCIDTHIQISGVQHIVGRFTKDGSGKLHFGFTRNTRGSGIDQASGATYRLGDTVHRTSIEVLPSVPTIYTEGYQGRLIRQGEGVPGDDAFLHFLTRIIINANGEVTVSVEIQNVDCR